MNSENPSVGRWVRASQEQSGNRKWVRFYRDGVIYGSTYTDSNVHLGDDIKMVRLVPHGGGQYTISRPWLGDNLEVVLGDSTIANICYSGFYLLTGLYIPRGGTKRYNVETTNELRP